jgi:small subunit ribosomal protein S2
MKLLSLTKLINTNIHIGHKLSKWDPRNSKYIYKVYKNNCIIDLIQTIKYLSKEYIYVYKTAQRQETILYVGSSTKSVSNLVALAAETSGNFYINTPWSGGTLTNWPLTRNKLILLKWLEYLFKTTSPDMYLTPKFSLLLQKKYKQLHTNLKGLVGLTKIPNAIILVTPKLNEGVIKESLLLNRILIGIIDTNTNPEVFSYPIPGNDDNFRSIELIIQILTTASIHGLVKNKILCN